VAQQRFDDALSLLEMGRTAAALYLVGYSVECMLKALILAVMPRGQEEEVLSMSRGALAHDYDVVAAPTCVIMFIPSQTQLVWCNGSSPLHDAVSELPEMPQTLWSNAASLDARGGGHEFANRVVKRRATGPVDHSFNVTLSR
jgi:hypothetical protein